MFFVYGPLWFVGAVLGFKVASDIASANRQEKEELSAEQFYSKLIALSQAEKQDLLASLPTNPKFISMDFEERQRIKECLQTPTPEAPKKNQIAATSTAAVKPAVDVAPTYYLKNKAMEYKGSFTASEIQQMVLNGIISTDWLVSPDWSKWTTISNTIPLNVRKQTDYFDDDAYYLKLATGERCGKLNEGKILGYLKTGVISKADLVSDDDHTWHQIGTVLQKA